MTTEDGIVEVLVLNLDIWVRRTKSCHPVTVSSVIPYCVPKDVVFFVLSFRETISGRSIIDR